MKRLFAALFIFPATLFAQEISAPQEVIRRHEIGVNLFAITDFNTSFHRYPGVTYTSASFHPVPGLYYRHYFGKNVLRVAVDYLSKAGSDNNDSYTWESTSRAGVIRAGYERELGGGKLVPYVASDLGFAYSKLVDNGTCETCSTPVSVTFTETKAEYGISAGAGIKYKPFPRMMLTLETSGQAFYRKTIKSTGYSNYCNDCGEFGLRYNPVRTLGLSFLF